VSTWQFNFKFDVSKDKILAEAKDMLSTAGISLDEHAKRGIDTEIFAEYLIASGLVLNEEIKWICFHGGFDFGYLIKMLIGEKLPDEDMGFQEVLLKYFPSFYDVKHMIKDIESLKKVGLSKLANELQVKRIGTPHQGGSDSLLTLSTYFKIKESYLKNTPESKYTNILFGLRSSDDEYSESAWSSYYMGDYTTMMMNNFTRPNSMHMMGNFYPTTNDAQFYPSMPMHNYMGYNNNNQGFMMDNSAKIKKFNSANKAKTQY